MTFTEGSWVYDKTSPDFGNKPADTTERRITISSDTVFPKKPDMVNSPAHYKQGDDGIECIDAIKAQLNDEEYIGYLRGNVAKYLWRLRSKGKPVEDSKKMQWYQGKLTEALSAYEFKTRAADVSRLR